MSSCGWRTTAALALYGICTQQRSPDGMFKKQCYSSSAFGIVGFHSAVSVKPGIFADTVVVLFGDLSVLAFCFPVPGWELDTGLRNGASASSLFFFFVLLNRYFRIQNSVNFDVLRGWAVEDDTLFDR